MSIPKISISNEDDAGLRQMSNSSTPPSPYKPIIKTRSSQPQTPPSSTSTTTQSYHTCQTRLDSYLSNDLAHNSSIKKKSTSQIQLKKQIIDENDTENDVSELSQTEDLPRSTTEQKFPKRRDTISTTSVLHSNENIHKRQSSLCRNRSLTTVNSDNSSTTVLNKPSQNTFIPHVSTPPPPLPYAEKRIRHSLTQIDYKQRKSHPVRRINSYRSSSSSTATIYTRFNELDGKLIQQEIHSSYPFLQRRSTVDNSSYPTTQIETSSIYETPKHEEYQPYISSNINNTIRLVTDTNLNTQLTINDRSDMQLDITPQNQEHIGVSRDGLSGPGGTGNKNDWSHSCLGVRQQNK
jgi:hypothetical protein